MASELADGQPGQAARFEFSKQTKKGKTRYGRRANFKNLKGDRPHEVKG